MAQVIPEKINETIKALRVMFKAKVDIPGIFFLQPIGKRHTLHYYKGHDGGYST